MQDPNTRLSAIHEFLSLPVAVIASVLTKAVSVISSLCDSSNSTHTLMSTESSI